jgi:hypothetical protein
MNVENIAARIIAVPTDLTFGAVLGSAFPIDHELRREFDECLAKLDSRSESRDGLEGARPNQPDGL